MLKKRVLMLSSRIPYPLTAGFRIRIYNEAKYFRKAGWEVDLLCMGKKEDESAFRNELAKVFSHIYVIPMRLPEVVGNLLLNILNPDEPFQNALYKSRQLMATLEKVSGNYDLIVGNHIRTAGYLLELRHYLSERQKTVPDFILDYHDAISYNYRNAIIVSKGLKKIIYRVEYGRVLRCEKKVASALRKLVIVSPKDKEWLGTQGAETDHIHVIPVAVRDDILAPNIEPDQDTTAINENEKESGKTAVMTEESICFLGKMSYQPNEDAVLWFADRVWPKIRKNWPKMRFYVMGIEPSERVRELGARDDHIIVTGFMENPFEQMTKCIANVVPIRNGAGVQNKVLESMLIGVPTIVSPIAAEGIDAQDGRDYLVAKTPDQYIDHIEKLMSLPGYRSKIGAAGQKVIKENYLWSGLWKKWEELINE